MTRLITILLLAVGAASAGCSTSPAQPATAADPETELRALLARADEAFDGRAYDDALDRYRAIHVAARSRDMRDIATESAAQVATVDALRDELGESDRWMGLAEDGATSKSPRAWSRVLLARGVRAWKRDQVSRARGTFIELYNYCKQNDETARALQAANLAALVSRGQEQLDWSLRAIECAQAFDNPKWEAPLWSSHAWLLDERGQYDDALRAFERARELTAESNVSPFAQLQVDWAYAHGLRRVGRLTEAREILERSQMIVQSIYVAKRTPRAAEWTGRILWELAEVDAAEGHSDRARARFAAAREKLIEAGAAQAAPDLLSELDARIVEFDRHGNGRRIPPPKRND